MVFKFCVVFIIELFIFCSFGKIIKIIIGILKVICDNNIFVKFKLINFIVVKKIKKLVLIIIFGEMSKMLLKLSNVFWFLWCFV